MAEIKNLLKNNREWAENIKRDDPDFFRKLSNQQSPQYLWIGCSDSRVPANQIVGMLPGELFVHRNVANVVVHSDLNCLSVVQFAVEVLKVEHIILCGHYGCGGVAAALRGEKRGLIDNWLGHVQDVRDKYTTRFSNLDSKRAWDLLCELNVLEQVANVCRTTIVRDAWARGAQLSVHGWIYGIEDGIIKDLALSISSQTEIDLIKGISAKNTSFKQL